MSRRGQLARIIRLVCLLVVAWCVMLLSHEGGHILAGWLGGGRLQAADLRPWRLPYSFFEPDPRPLVRLWGGPLLGVLVPYAVAAYVRRDSTWFVAHFCALANGCYLAVAWISPERYLDTAQLLEHGAWPAAIAVYCCATLSVGYLGFRRQCRQALTPPEPRPPLSEDNQQSD
jgi:hypothetical protein